MTRCRKHDWEATCADEDYVWWQCRQCDREKRTRRDMRQEAIDRTHATAERIRRLQVCGTCAHGTFTLYEDDGLTYGYEKGAFARIPIHWDDAAKTLTLGKREGRFPGMLAKRTFNVVLVTKDKPAGFSFTPKADRIVAYQGKEAKVKFELMR